VEWQLQHGPVESMAGSSSLLRMTTKNKQKQKQRQRQKQMRSSLRDDNPPFAMEPQRMGHPHLWR